MKNKTNKKPSPNRIKCQISGEERMSNRKYIAAKADKAGVASAVWCSFYVNKASMIALKAEVEANGLDKAAEVYNVDKARVIKWLRYNGRGAFVAQKQVAATV